MSNSPLPIEDRAALAYQSLYDRQEAHLAMATAEPERYGFYAERPITDDDVLDAIADWTTSIDTDEVLSDDEEDLRRLDQDMLSEIVWALIEEHGEES